MLLEHGVQHQRTGLAIAAVADADDDKADARLFDLRPVHIFLIFGNIHAEGLAVFQHAVRIEIIEFIVDTLDAGHRLVGALAVIVGLAAGGAPAGVYRFRVALVQPDDEIVVHIAHGADDIDLILHALPVFLGSIRVALLKALLAEHPEIPLVGIALRHRIGRQMVLMERKVHIAHLGNLHRIVKGLVAAREQLAKLLLAFQIEFLGFKTHPVQIVHRLAGLDAQQDVMGLGVPLPKIVGVIGADHRDTGLLMNLQDRLVHDLLIPDAVILQF